MPSHLFLTHKSRLYVLIATAILLACASGVRAQGPVCGPAPDVKAALDQLPSRQTPSQTSWQFHQQRLAAIQALLSRFPNNVFVQRAYIDSMWAAPDRDKVIEQYKAPHQRAPDDSPISYLYGLTLLGRRSPEAIELFDSALEKDPQFMVPHLSLASVYTSRNFLDKEKAITHAKAFLAACPSTFDGYEMLADIDDPQLAAQGAARLQQLLHGRSDPDAVRMYSTLWALEFKAKPLAEYDTVRKQVAEDLKRVRALNLQDKWQWYQALEDGYKLANDQKQSDWAKEERERRFPQPWELTAMERWRKDHEYPARDAAVETKRAYFADLAKQTEQWLKERPNTSFIWWQRLDALVHLEDTPAAAIEAVADQAFRVSQANAGPRNPDSDAFFTVAEALSKRGLEPARVVEMAQKGLAQLEIESREPPYDLWLTKEDISNNQFYLAAQRVQGLAYEADGYLRLKQADKAQAVLAQFDQRLPELKSLAGDKEPRKKECLSRESSYWGMMARLAEVQGRKLDAMAFYENALLARLEAQERPETGFPDELADNARRLWAGLGGTDEGWKSWYGRRADALALQSQLTWEAANDPLPGFELTDLHGKTWKPADLKGKVTFLNFWASW